MNTIQSIGDLIESIIYEVLGLVIPGLVLLVALAGLFPEHLVQHTSGSVVAYFETNWIAAVLAAYVLGYVIQGIAAIAISLGERTSMRKPPDGGGDRLSPPEARSSCIDPDDAAATRAFRSTAKQYWKKPGRGLKNTELNDYAVASLCYAAIGSSTKRMERFQATKHLARGVTIVCIFTILTLFIQTLLGPRQCNLDLDLVLVALIVCVLALLERTARFGRLWDTILFSQFAWQFVATEAREPRDTPTRTGMSENTDMSRPK